MPTGLVYPPSRSRFITSVYDSTNVLTASVIGAATPTPFLLTVTIPAGTITTGVVLRCTFGYQITTATAAGITGFTVSVLSANPAVTNNLYSATSITPNNSLTGRGFAMDIYIIGTTPPIGGSNVNVETVAVTGAFSATTVAGLSDLSNSIAQPVAVPTFKDLILESVLTYAANTAGTNMGLRSIIVEQLGP